jgi:hypothetical protein
MEEAVLKIGKLFYPVEGTVESSLLEEGHERIKCEKFSLSKGQYNKEAIQAGAERIYYRHSFTDEWRTRKDFLNTVENPPKERETLDPPPSRPGGTKEWYPKPGYGPSW